MVVVEKETTQWHGKATSYDGPKAFGRERPKRSDSETVPKGGRKEDNYTHGI